MLDLQTSWQAFPTLNTERLILRELTLADTEAHFTLFSNPKIAEAHGQRPFQNTEESEWFINYYSDAFARQEAIRWGVALKSNTAVIGTCGFHALSKRHHRAEVGYELHPDYWRQGIMSEAVRAILRFGFRQMGLHRIEANVDPNNAISANLLRKLGFKEEGYLRERFNDNGRFVDDWYFSLLAREFK